MSGISVMYRSSVVRCENNILMFCRGQKLPARDGTPKQLHALRQYDNMDCSNT